MTIACRRTINAQINPGFGHIKNEPQEILRFVT